MYETLGENMTPYYKEIDFETHIEEHLLSSGYHKCIPDDYEKDLCLIAEESLLFIKSTQLKEFKSLKSSMAPKPK